MPRNLCRPGGVGRSMRRAPLAAVLLVVTATGVARAATRDSPPPFPVDAGPAPWEQPFSVVAGGGTRRPAAGMVAGLADLGRVWGGARDGSGRAVVVTTTGTWVVGLDGRLTGVRGLPAPPKPGRYDRPVVPGPRALAALPDGRVAIGDPIARRVVALDPGSTTARPLATAPKPVEALGLDADGSLLGVAGGRLLRLRDGTLVPSERLTTERYYGSSGGIGAVPGGLLAAQASSNEAEADSGRLDLLGPSGTARSVYRPPSVSSLRGVAVLPDGRALLATNAFSEGELDDRPITLAAGKTLDRQSFDYGVGEEYYGWISRRRTLLRLADGSLRRVRWAGPPADAIAPDGATDVLVASAGRLWSTRPGLAAPELDDFAKRRVGVRLGAPATVLVTSRIQGGEISVAAGPTLLPAGRSVVQLPELGPGLQRVTITARTPNATTVSSAYAFPPAQAFAPRDADRVLSAIARRLNIGFEGALYHGVDRCRSRNATEVVCRWTSANAFGEGPRPTERDVRIRFSPAGYEVLGGKPHPSPKRGRNTDLLGAPFDASA